MSKQHRGCAEDVVDILLNLKTRGAADALARQRRAAPAQEGPGPGDRGRHQTDHDIEVVNPELVIANLTKPRELSMTLRVERGRGYRPAASRVAFEEQTRRSAACSSMRPSRRCGALTYSVDAARVEQRTDLDKLVIDMRD